MSISINGLIGFVETVTVGQNDNRLSKRELEQFVHGGSSFFGMALAATLLTPVDEIVAGVAISKVGAGVAAGAAIFEASTKGMTLLSTALDNGNMPYAGQDGKYNADELRFLADILEIKNY